MKWIHKLKIVYTFTLTFGILSVYLLANPAEPLRTQSLSALLAQFGFLIGFGLIIGIEIGAKEK